MKRKKILVQVTSMLLAASLTISPTMPVTYAQGNDENVNMEEIVDEDDSIDKDDPDTVEDADDSDSTDDKKNVEENTKEEKETSKEEVVEETEANETEAAETTEIPEETKEATTSEENSEDDENDDVDDKADEAVTESETKNEISSDEDDKKDADTKEEIATASELKRTSKSKDVETNDAEDEPEMYIADNSPAQNIASPSNIYRIASASEIECPTGVKLVKQTLKKKVRGFLITATGMIPEGAELQVEQLDNEDDLETVINENKADDDKKFSAKKAFDIEIIQEDGEPYQPMDYSQKITISIKGIEMNEGADIEVYRVSDDETEVDELESGLADKITEFKTEHFTTFVIGTTEYNVEDNWYVNWEYTKDDTEKTITLGKYVGSSSDVDIVIPGTATIAGEDYQVVIDSNENNSRIIPIRAKTVIIDENAYFKNVSYLFYNSSNLIGVNTEDWDLSHITDMSDMFCNCYNLKTLDISTWDISSVTNMSFMFYGCYNLKTLDISTWDISSVTNMSAMFNGCSSLDSLDLSSWDTSSVTNMSTMFNGCSSLDSLDLSSWDTSSVTNMSGMFYRCSSLTTLNVSDWDVSGVTDMSYMFNGCSSLDSLDLSTWDISEVTNTYVFLRGCNNLTLLKTPKTYPQSEISLYDIRDKAMCPITSDTSPVFGAAYNVFSETAETPLETWFTFDYYKVTYEDRYDSSYYSEYVRPNANISDLHPGKWYMSEWNDELGVWQETEANLTNITSDMEVHNVYHTIDYYDMYGSYLYQETVERETDASGLHEGVWYDSNFGGHVVDLTNITSDMSVYSGTQFEVKYCAPNGNSFYSEYAEPGSDLSGYHEGPWYKDPELTEEADLTNITDNMTVYKLGYTVTYRDTDDNELYQDTVEPNTDASYMRSDDGPWYTDIGLTTPADLTNITADTTVYCEKTYHIYYRTKSDNQIYDEKVLPNTNASNLHPGTWYTTPACDEVADLSNVTTNIFVYMNGYQIHYQNTNYNDIYTEAVEEGSDASNLHPGTWYTTPACDEVADLSNVISDMYVYQQRCRVTYYDDRDWSVLYEEYPQSGEDISALHPGKWYINEGWDDDSGSGYKYTEADLTNITSDMDVHKAYCNIYYYDTYSNFLYQETVERGTDASTLHPGKWYTRIWDDTVGDIYTLADLSDITNGMSVYQQIYTLTYLDIDGNVLYTETVDKGDDATSLHPGTWYQSMYSITPADLTNITYNMYLYNDRYMRISVYDTSNNYMYDVFVKRGNSPVAGYDVPDNYAEIWYSDLVCTTLADLSSVTSDMTVYQKNGPAAFKGAYQITVPACILLDYNASTEYIISENDITVTGHFEDGDFIEVEMDDFQLVNTKDNKYIPIETGLTKTKLTGEDTTHLSLRSKDKVSDFAGTYTGTATLKITSGNE